jgi:hypothetical protein
VAGTAETVQSEHCDQARSTSFAYLRLLHSGFLSIAHLPARSAKVACQVLGFRCHQPWQGFALGSGTDACGSSSNFYSDLLLLTYHALLLSG